MTDEEMDAELAAIAAAKPLPKSVQATLAPKFASPFGPSPAQEKKGAVYAVRPREARPGAVYARDFNPGQPRDDHGRWTGGGVANSDISDEDTVSVGDDTVEVGGSDTIDLDTAIKRDPKTAIGDAANNYTLRPVDPSVIPRDPKLTGRMKQIETDFANKLAKDPAAAWEEYKKFHGTKNGLILSADDARELSPDYRADKSMSAAVHEPASWFIKEVYANELQRPLTEDGRNDILFTAGGTGAGKSTAIAIADPSALDSAFHVYDTNFSNEKSGWKKVDQALATGRDVGVIYVDRDPEVSWEAAMHRAETKGRTVPMEAHIDTHIFARKVLEDSVEHYAGDGRVSFDIIDNNPSKAQGGARVVSSPSELPKYNYDRLEERLTERLERAHNEGRISDRVYLGMKGKGP